jgi:hypothetical protein
MTLGQFLLKTCFPEREKERMKYRFAVMEATATAEDLGRTLVLHKDDIKKALKKTNGSSQP